MLGWAGRAQGRPLRRRCARRAVRQQERASPGAEDRAYAPHLTPLPLTPTPPPAAGAAEQAGGPLQGAALSPRVSASQWRARPHVPRVAALLAPELACLHQRLELRRALRACCNACCGRVRLWRSVQPRCAPRFTLQQRSAVHRVAARLASGAFWCEQVAGCTCTWLLRSNVTVLRASMQPFHVRRPLSVHPPRLPPAPVPPPRSTISLSNPDTTNYTPFDPQL